ncbi:restriction endonuclease subunit S [Desulfofustis glycolicus]|uniref:Type I restriction enzyme, S subunit n=1 Tax=Desulfofustis glycolicus DSM 9705 TaxID=1121409 RepID=A0A1M5YLM9_9BACT|nr:restriction endonuclease subunit S [Desulfofustis glycolicus]SHI12987.1 type I restriction enzyme, S subunit [Desulfofustis glycolicus DSM 9705]
MKPSVAMITVGQLADWKEADIQTGPFGTQLQASEYVESGIPVINVRNVGFGDVRDSNLEFITEAKADRLNVHRLKKGDIVFGRKGAVERHALISEKQVGWVQGSDCLRLRLSSETICGRYFSYYLRTRAHHDWMQAMCSFGATMASLNQGIVKRISLPLRGLPTQRKIAAILTAYDDLIENNKRRIALLEKTVEELYREWFVRMRFPGYQNVKFVKGVPKAWSRLPISELISFLSRGVSPKYSDRSQKIVINQRCIRDGTIDLSNAKTHETTIPGKKILKRGDVLINSTGVGTLGRSAVLWETTEDLTCDSHITICRANHKKVVPLFLGFSIQLLHSYFDQLAVGSTGQTELNRSFIAMTKILVPELELQNKFEAEATPIVSLACKLRAANRVLTQTRDLLLPRLISGKLSVDDLDIQFPPSMREEAG